MRLLNIGEIHVSLSSKIVEKIQTCWNGAPFCWALFGGTPGARRKMTLQISTGNTIRGYAKVSDKPEIIQLFYKEKEMLDYLHTKGVEPLPHVIYLGPISDNNSQYLFVQDTRTSVEAFSTDKWGSAHWNFCQLLVEKTKSIRSLEQTDYIFYLHYLQMNAKCIDGVDVNILYQAISIVCDYYSKQRVYAAFHGDFTPWNTYQIGEILYPYDWEYAARYFPLYMDAAHFLLQVAIIGKHLKAEESYRYFKSFHLSEKWTEIEHEDVFLLSYLLYILSFYTQLYEGKWQVNDRCYRVWCALIQKIVREWA
jgi:hypothetical protein